MNIIALIGGICFSFSIFFGNSSEDEKEIIIESFICRYFLRFVPIMKQQI